MEYARRGRYRRLEVNRGLPARMLLKYFVRDGDEWEISAEVRSMVEFQAGEPVRADAVAAVFDLVLLRNVLLYFPQQDQRMRADGCVSDDASAWSFVAGECGAGGGFYESFGWSSQADCYFYRPVAVRGRV